MKHIELALTYIGKKEKPGNSGFEDPQFEADMVKFGEWQKGFAWCACFCQMIYRKAYPDLDTTLKKLFSPSTRDTFNNFKAAGCEISQKPVLGALVIWASYERGIMKWTGHAGIVSQVMTDGTFKSIEGNTSANGSRNGDRVFEQKRDTKIKATGLNVMGFILINQPT